MSRNIHLLHVTGSCNWPLIKGKGMEYWFAAEWGGVYRPEYTCVWRPTLAQGWELKEARPGPPSMSPSPPPHPPEPASHSAEVLIKCRFWDGRRPTESDYWEEKVEINIVETPSVVLMPLNFETPWSRKGCVCVTSQAFSFILSALLDRKSSLFFSYLMPELTHQCEN